jgi:hypothetical protein
MVHLEWISRNWKAIEQARVDASARRPWTQEPNSAW